MDLPPNARWVVHQEITRSASGVVRIRDRSGRRTGLALVQACALPVHSGEKAATATISITATKSTGMPAVVAAATVVAGQIVVSATEAAKAKYGDKRQNHAFHESIFL